MPEDPEHGMPEGMSFEKIADAVDLLDAVLRTERRGVPRPKYSAALWLAACRARSQLSAAALHGERIEREGPILDSDNRSKRIRRKEES